MKKRREKYVTLTASQLDVLLEMAVLRGMELATMPMMSRRQAEKMYGSGTIRRLIEQGLIEGHRQGAAANSKVLFGREEIERAIMG